MTEKSNRPFTANSETLTDGSVIWYVLHCDSLERIGFASDEAAVTDLEMQLNSLCESWAEESPDHIVIKEA